MDLFLGEIQLEHVKIESGGMHIMGEIAEAEAW